jgi:hypothetical protein
MRFIGQLLKCGGAGTSIPDVKSGLDPRNAGPIVQKRSIVTESVFTANAHPSADVAPGGVR